MNKTNKNLKKKIEKAVTYTLSATMIGTQMIPSHISAMEIEQKANDANDKDNKNIQSKEEAIPDKENTTTTTEPKETTEKKAQPTPEKPQEQTVSKAKEAKEVKEEPQFDASILNRAKLHVVDSLAAFDETTEIPDANFRLALKTAINATNPNSVILTEDNLSKITTLTWNGTEHATQKISDLKGLKYLKGLGILALPNNTITGDKISEITGLGEELTRVDLSGNQGLGNAGASAVAQSKAVRMFLSNTGITSFDTKAFSNNTRLVLLDLSRNTLGTVSLSGDTSLSELSLESASITGTIRLEGLSALNSLSLRVNNALTAIAGDGLPQVKSLNISGTGIKDISGAKSLTALIANNVTSGLDISTFPQTLTTLGAKNTTFDETKFASIVNLDSLTSIIISGSTNANTLGTLLATPKYTAGMSIPRLPKLKNIEANNLVGIEPEQGKAILREGLIRAALFKETDRANNPTFNNLYLAGDNITSLKDVIYNAGVKDTIRTPGNTEATNLKPLFQNLDLSDNHIIDPAIGADYVKNRLAKGKGDINNQNVTADRQVLGYNSKNDYVLSLFKKIGRDQIGNYPAAGIFVIDGFPNLNNENYPPRAKSVTLADPTQGTITSSANEITAGNVKIHVNDPNISEIKLNVKLYLYRDSGILQPLTYLAQTYDNGETYSATVTVPLKINPVFTEGVKNHIVNVGDTSFDPLKGVTAVGQEGVNISSDWTSDKVNTIGKKAVLLTLVDGKGNVTEKTIFVYVVADEKDIADIKDVNLLRELNRQFGIADIDAPILISKLKTLSGNLNLPGKGIHDLSGLEYCSGITGLNLSSNLFLDDFTPISKLPSLQSLNLSGTTVQALTGLTEGGALPKLKTLNLSGMVSLTDVSGLENFIGLTSLNISGDKKLTSVPGLAQLTMLTMLDASSTGIGNTDLAAGLQAMGSNLTTLKLAQTKNLTDIASVEGQLTNLNTVDVNGSSLQNIQFLKGSKLTGLSLMNMPELASLNDSIQGITTLTSLTINNTPLLTSLGGDYVNSNLNTVSITNAPKLTDLGSGWGKSSLTTTTLNGVGVTSLGDTFVKSGVVTLNITNCDSLNSMGNWAGNTTLANLKIYGKTGNNLGTGMKNLTNLDGLEGLGSSLRNLTLSHLYGMTDLMSATKKIDVSKVVNLGLYYLNIADLDGFRGGEEADLQRASIAHNPLLTNIDGLKNAPRLSSLYLMDNTKLTTISAVQGRDFSALNNLYLSVDIKGIPDSDIYNNKANTSPTMKSIAGLRNVLPSKMNNVYMWDSGLTDLNGLENLRTINNLSIGNSGVMSLNGIEDIEGINTFTINKTNLNDISALTDKATSLKVGTLNAVNANIDNAKLKNFFDHITFDKNAGFTAFAAGAKAPDVPMIDFSNNSGITDVSSILNFQGDLASGTLNLSSCNISNLPELTDSTALNTIAAINLNNNHISSLKNFDKLNVRTSLDATGQTVRVSSVAGRSGYDAIQENNHMINGTTYADISNITPGGKYTISTRKIAWIKPDVGTKLSYNFSKKVGNRNLGGSFNSVVALSVSPVIQTTPLYLYQKQAYNPRSGLKVLDNNGENSEKAGEAILNGGSFTSTVDSGFQTDSVNVDGTPVVRVAPGTKPGVYTQTVSVTNEFNQTAQETREIHILEALAPVIKGNTTPITIKKGDPAFKTLILDGITATVNEYLDTNPNDAVSTAVDTIEADVRGFDVDTPATYQVPITATSGTKTSMVERDVIVRELHTVNLSLPKDFTENVTISLAKAKDMNRNLWKGVTYSDTVDTKEQLTKTRKITDGKGNTVSQLPLPNTTEKEVTQKLVYEVTNTDGVKATQTVNITVTNHVPEFTQASKDAVAKPLSFIAYTYKEDGFAGIVATDVEDDQLPTVGKLRIQAEIKTKGDAPTTVATVTDSEQFLAEMNKLTSEATTPKMYEVIYTATDSDGNTSAPLTREIQVETNLAPVLKFKNGTAVEMIDIHVSQVDDYNKSKLREGITITDDHDTLSPADLIVTGTLKKPEVSTTPSEQKIIYTVKDAQGNIANEIVRTYRISNQAPVFGNDVEGYLHDHPITTRAGIYKEDPYSGITATDAEDGSVTITSAIFKDSGQVGTAVTSGEALKNEINTLLPGDYSIQYSVTDSDGNTKKTTNPRILTVQTNDAPVLTFENSSEVLYINYGEIDAYNAKLKADILIQDDHDTLTAEQIEIVSANKTLVKPATPSPILSVQQITYRITDTDGNNSNEITRDYYISNQAPAFTMGAKEEAKKEIRLFRGIYKGNPMANIEASDKEDAPDKPTITAVIKNSATTEVGTQSTTEEELRNAINKLDNGTYTIEYKATDKDGNTATLERALVVDSNEAPVIKFTSNHSNTEEVSINAGQITAENAKLKAGIEGKDDHDVINEANIHINGVDQLSVPVAGDTLNRQEIHYYAQDSQGNKSAEIVRTYSISNQKPQFTPDAKNNANKKLTVYRGYFPKDEDPFAKFDATDKEDDADGKKLVISAQITGNSTALPAAHNSNALVEQLKGLTISADYTIHWTVTDSDSNTATLLQLVDVVSNDKPVLSFENNTDTIHIKAGEIGAYNAKLKDQIGISDDHDGASLTKDDIQVQGRLTLPGVSEAEISQTIQYSITDKQGNVSDPIKRTYMISNQAPKFSDDAKSFMDNTTLEVYERIYTGDVFDGIVATDKEDGSTSPVIHASIEVNGKTETGTTAEEMRTIINKLGIGDTILTYTATDTDGNTVSHTRKLTVKANTKPELVFTNNSKTVRINSGEIPTYTLDKLKDDIEIHGNIDNLTKDDIEIVGTDHLTKPGVSDTPDTQQISYRITDKRHNISDTITRIYEISNQAPKYSAETSELVKTPISVYRGIYAEDVFDGIGANDKEDGAISIIKATLKDESGDIVSLESDPIVIREAINKLRPGDYTLEYSVGDSDGNTTTIDRKIEVLTNDTPVLTFTSNHSDSETVKINYNEIAKANSEILKGIDLKDDHGTTLDGLVKSGFILTPTEPQDDAIIQKITFTITDAQGNTSKPITRIYEISNQAPKFSEDAITAAKTPYNMRAKKENDKFMDAIQAMDKEDNDSIAGRTLIKVRLEKENQTVFSDLDPENANDRIKIFDALHDLIPGDYTLTYIATDNDGNTTLLKRDMIVETNNAPVFHGVETVYINAANVDEYNQKLIEGVRVSDDHDDLTQAVKIEGKLSVPAVNDIGDMQTIQYSVVDSDGNSASFTRTYIVVNQLPKFTAASLEIVKKPIIFVEGKWNGHILDGIFAETFDPSSMPGNSAGTVVRTVKLLRLQLPSNEGLNPLELEKQQFIHTAADAPHVTTSYTDEELNTLKHGKYQLVYTATDALRNTVAISREIIVEPAIIPNVQKPVSTIDKAEKNMQLNSTVKALNTSDISNVGGFLSLLGESGGAMIFLTYKKRKGKKDKR